MAFSREERSLGGKIVEIIYPLHEIDSFNGEEIKAYVHMSAYNAFVINFSRVNYMNSSGIRELIQILKYLKEEGKTLILTDLSEEINKIFRSTNLHRLFNIQSEKSVTNPEG